MPSTCLGIARRMTWFAATRLPHPEPDREGKLAMHAMAKVSVLIIALLVATAGYLYYQHSIPLLYRHSEPGDPVKEPTFAIFNPFRDRSPERSAEAFLAALKAGQCDVAMSFLSDRSVERIQEMCERDKEHPLVDWRLRNRSDQFDKVRIYFQVNRSGYDGYKGQSWVTVEKKLTVGKWPTMSVFIEDLVAPKNVACGSSGKKFVN